MSNNKRKRLRGSCSGSVFGHPTDVVGVGRVFPSVTARQVSSRAALKRANRLNSSIGAVLPVDTAGLNVDTDNDGVSALPDVNSTCQSVVDSSVSNDVTIYYRDLGDCDRVCNYCSASFWFDERIRVYSDEGRLHYHKCCVDGRVHLPLDSPPPLEFVSLLESRHFMENIRAYNQMFSMTSFGARIDDSVNNHRGPYVFKISGQVYHWMGSLCPPNNDIPRFLQLYIYDTENEVRNRMSHFGGEVDSGLDAGVVRQLIRILNTHNQLVQLFRIAKDRYIEADIPNFKIRLFSVTGSKQYELPVSNAIGAIVYGEDARSESDYDVIVELKGGTPQRINKLHQSYMSLQFPLLFLYGQPGYHPGLKLRETGRSIRGRSKRMTMNMYYSYQIRDRFRLCGSLTVSGRLFQQYVVTAYCSIELERIDYIRNNQNDIRNEYLSGLYDAINRGDQTGSDVGSRTILPASFTGSPRYMYSHYLDALAICRVHGNPKFFITFTCNSKWPEIKRYLARFPYLSTVDRADIVTRIFEIKVNKFVKYLKEERPFGHVTAVLYTIEFQKRGTPHCHTLLWIESPASAYAPANIDQYISAELPNPITDPLGYKVVSEFMMHGPCGIINLAAPCMEGYVCKKKFPKPYNVSTYFDKRGYAQYQRRNTGVTTKRGNVELDNGYVVPYNRSLCLIFHAHINVEYCGWTMLIKYLFKYISKGTDRIVMRISRPVGEPNSESNNVSAKIDEIQNFVDGRFICPYEACWRIYGFPIHHREPAVQLLAVHLEGGQLLRFRSRQTLQSIVNNPYSKKTTLTEWLQYNSIFPEGHHLTYLDFPREFVWAAKDKVWTRRRNLNRPLLGRLSYMHPTTGEVFYLRMLLCHKKGCKSFQDIRTVNGVVYPTYRSACEAFGLLGDDREWTITLEEASASATSAQLRSLFVHILIFCEVVNPVRLWNENWKLMADDIPLRDAVSLNMDNLHINEPELQQYVLCEIELLLSQHNKCLTDYGLPSLSNNVMQHLSNRLLMEERNYDREALRTESEILIKKMNEKQKFIYDLIINASASRKQELVFVYGFGGTGKTFLWKCIITFLRSQGKIVLAVASSGIASLLLPAGRTAHSRFKLPIDLTDETVCNIKKNTHLGNLLKETELIVWDEAPMNDKKCFETLDRTLRDILDCEDLPFGGKSIILGGDFRQTMPVKQKASKQEIINLSIVCSYLWRHFKVIKLKENMRLQQTSLSSDARIVINNFSKWLLDIGNGNLGEPDEEDPLDSSWINIPDEYQIADDENGMQNLISFIYSPDMLKQPSALELQSKVIVCPKNDDADMINNLIVNTVDKPSKIYYSYDEAKPYGNDRGESEVLYPNEYLNTLNFPGVPPHELELKVGVPVILLRNLNLAGGLCNGTRMIVTQLFSTSIEAEIITGARVGEKVYIPKICLIHKETALPFILRRKQLPIKISYAMTINKSQGQSLSKIGIYLPQPVFGHGQLYVALSRATSPNGLKILMKQHENHNTNTTKNIVFKDFLQMINETQGLILFPLHCIYL